MAAPARSVPPPVAPLRVGIDLVRVPEVSDSLASHGAHYLDRVYTEREVADCRSGDGAVAPHRLAARFAAKEAALKVLRPAPDRAVPWRTIEVRRAAAGHTELELSGAAEAEARAQGVEQLAVSLTHEGEYASAVVVGQVTPCR
jgi:holo-[acyl-carrier protein] synthase